MLRIGRAVVGLMACLVLIASAAPAPRRAAGLADLMSPDPAVVQRTREDVLAAHRERVRALVDVVEDKDLLWNKPSTVMAAVELLGEMRAVEAAEPLAAIIGYPDVRPPGGPPFRRFIHKPPWPVPWWSAPEEGSVADALIKIGRPCLPAVLKKLGETSNPVETEPCLKVLFFLTGRDGAECALEGAGAGKEGPRGDRLAKALGMLKHAPEVPAVPPRLRAYLPSVAPDAGGG